MHSMTSSSQITHSRWKLLQNTAQGNFSMVGANTGEPGHELELTVTAIGERLSGQCDVLEHLPSLMPPPNQPLGTKG